VPFNLGRLPFYPAIEKFCGGFLQMSPLKLFAAIRERRRRSAQQACEPIYEQTFEHGALITRRVKELLAVPMPPKVETASIIASCDNDPI
jgi:hypothetical protein